MQRGEMAKRVVGAVEGVGYSSRFKVLEMSAEEKHFQSLLYPQNLE